MYVCLAQLFGTYETTKPAGLVKGTELHFVLGHGCTLCILGLGCKARRGGKSIACFSGPQTLVGFTITLEGLLNRDYQTPTADFPI